VGLISCFQWDIAPDDKIVFSSRCVADLYDGPFGRHMRN
jgi:hypothetical protein